MVNQVTLIGRLGKDPEVKQFEDGNKVVSLNIATWEKYQSQGEWKEKTEWHRAVVWGPKAEYIIGKYHKGDKVYINGKVTYRSYKDQNGEEKYLTEIQAFQVKMVEKKDKDDYQNSYLDPAQTHKSIPETTQRYSNTSEEVVEQEDLPF